MKRGLIGLVVVGLVLGQSGLCAAALDYTQEGRVVSTGPYDGPSVSLAEAVILAAATLTLRADTFGPQWSIASGIFPTTAILWGAWRTSQYRPESVKDAIHANLKEMATRPVPGTARDVLE